MNRWTQTPSGLVVPTPDLASADARVAELERVVAERDAQIRALGKTIDQLARELVWERSEGRCARLRREITKQRRALEARGITPPPADPGPHPDGGPNLYMRSDADARRAVERAEEEELVREGYGGCPHGRARRAWVNGGSVGGLFLTDIGCYGRCDGEGRRPPDPREDGQAGEVCRR